MRGQITMGTACLLALGWVGWALLTPSTPDPVVQGKRLSRWVAELDSTVIGSEVKPPEACVAVREAGSLGIPRYLALLESRNGILNNYWIAGMLQRAPLLDRAARRLGYRGYNSQRWQGLWGFKVLGTNGAPAVPALVALLGRQADAQNSEPAQFSAFALSYLGPAGIQALTNALKADAPTVRLRAVRGLYSAGTNGLSVLDSLLRALEDSSAPVRRSAAHALGALGRSLRAGASEGPFPQEQRFAATFIAGLTDQDPEVRETCADELAGYPSAASVQALQTATHDPNTQVRDFAAHSLATIRTNRAAEARPSP